MKIPRNISKEIKKAIRNYEKFHWGAKATNISKVKLPEPPEVCYQLGIAAFIGYVTQKGDDKEPILYVHAFEKNPGFLCGDPDDKKSLFISHGGYKVEEEGISG